MAPLKPVLLAAALPVLAACASTDHGARGAGERPLDASSTEASLWYQMDEMERTLQASGRVLDDRELHDYVTGVLCRVSGAHCADMRLYIVEAPEFNASMAPNGMTLVHTGLLLRAGSEDELAFVLAHEFVHFEENHSLENHAARRNATISAMVLGTALGVGVAAAGGSARAAGDAANLGVIASYATAFSFSRDAEREADAKGFDYLVAAGYDPHAAPRIWENFSTEIEAWDDEAPARRAARESLFSTHPLIRERIGTLSALAGDRPADGSDARAYRARIRPHLQAWLEDQVEAVDPGAAIHLIERLARSGEDLGVLNHARGQALAARYGSQALSAAEAWQEAARHPDAPAETWRALGEHHRGHGRAPEAAAAYRTYLQRAPDAPDALFIERLIETLETPR